MATQIIEAYASVADVTDGAAGISILLSNENHTFVADTTGAIVDTEIAAFTTDIDVLVGTSFYAYTPGSATLASGQWRISTGAAEGVAAITAPGGLTAALSDQGDAARLQVTNAAGDDGFADGGNASPDSVQLVVPIQVRHGSVTRMFNRVITFSKAKGGTARVLRLTAGEATLPFDKSGTLREASRTVIFDVSLVNFDVTTANVAWEYRLVPTAAWTAFPTGAGIVFSETNQRRLTITRQALANLLTGSARLVSIRASLSSRIDVVSVLRVQDGADGNDGAVGKSVIELRILARSSTVLRNNQGSVIFDARLYYRGNAATAAIVGYQWFNRSGATNTNITGATAAFREFDAATTGGGVRLIGCSVSFDDTHADVNG